MTSPKLEVLVLLTVALLASACEGSQGGESTAAPQTPESLAIEQALVIGIPETGGLLPLIDPLAGIVIGSVDSGYKPGVLLRRTSEQLLVSQSFGPGLGRADESSLAVFDLDDLSSPSAIIPMPGRPSYTVYSPYAVLSRDERYLYYPRVASICPDGGDSAVCDKWSVGIIDLDAGKQVAQAEIGLGCAPRIQVDSQVEDAALVTCGNVAMSLVEFTPDVVGLMRISPDGTTSELGAFPGRRPDGAIGSVLFAGVRADGTYFAVYKYGAVFNAGGEEAVIDLLPEEDGEFGFNTGAALGSEGYLLASRARSDHYFSHVLVLNAAEPEVFQTFEVPFPFDHLALIDDRHVALLHSFGYEISILDIETGSVTSALTLSRSVEWLSGGRASFGRRAQAPMTPVKRSDQRVAMAVVDTMSVISERIGHLPSWPPLSCSHQALARKAAPSIAIGIVSTCNAGAMASPIPALPTRPSTPGTTQHQGRGKKPLSGRISVSKWRNLLIGWLVT